MHLRDYTVDSFSSARPGTCLGSSPPKPIAWLTVELSICRGDGDVVKAVASHICPLLPRPSQLEVKELAECRTPPRGKRGVHKTQCATPTFEKSPLHGQYQTCLSELWGEATSLESLRHVSVCSLSETRPDSSARVDPVASQEPDCKAWNDSRQLLQLWAAFLVLESSHET